jgi:glucose/arabinose dehydrogenase
VYVFYSDADTGLNRVVRIRAEGDAGTDVEPVIDLLPWVNGYHNGGDLAFAVDGTLFVSVGEAHEPGRAQDPDDLGGKILRIAPDGTVPEDNPTAGSPVYALGIRNSFGLCVDPTTGDLWETENGPDSFDEVNLIEPGGNHGWPDQLGPGGEPTYVDPVLAFEDVIVPTGCAVTEDGSTLYFGTYGGEIRRLTLPPGDEPRDTVVATTGAVTDVARAPDGSIWVSTSDAIYRAGDLGAGGSPSPAASETAATGPTGGTGDSVPSASPSPDTAPNPLSPATIVIALVLLGGLYLARRRMGGGR